MFEFICAAVDSALPVLCSLRDICLSILSESAVRERKRFKRKWQEGSSVHEGSTSIALSPGSSGQRHDEATDIQLCTEKGRDVGDMSPFC